MRTPVRAAALLAVVLVPLFGATIPLPVGSAVPTALAHAASPASWVLLDGFEDGAWPDPGLWRLPAPPDSTWAPSTCQAKNGARSLRAFAGPWGSGSGEPPCGASVAAGSVSRATMTLDLRAALEATRLDLYFDLWLRMPDGDDQGLFLYLVVPQGDGTTERLPIFGGTAMGGLWAYPRRLDLLNLDDVTHPDKPIDLRGGKWEIEWVAYAPRGVPAGGGIFVDNVALVWEPDPAVPTPTVRITLTPTPSLTPTDEPTPTPRPTRTPTATVPATDTPTPEPPPPAAYLPLVRRDARPTATATPSQTPGETGTPGGAGTVEATGTPGAIETPTGIATATVEVAPSPTATASQTPGPPETPVTPTATTTPGPMDWHVYLPVVQPVAESAEEPTEEAPTPGSGTPGAPTPGAPTPDAPTPGVPTPDAPTPGVPTIESPTAEGPTRGSEMSEAQTGATRTRVRRTC